MRIFDVFRPDRFASKAKDSESSISRFEETLRQILLTNTLNKSNLDLSLMKRGSHCQQFSIRILISKLCRVLLVKIDTSDRIQRKYYDFPKNNPKKLLDCLETSWWKELCQLTR